VMLSVIVVFTVIILYIILRVRNRRMKVKELIGKSIKLDEISEPVVKSSNLIPPLPFGREYGMSFWLYLDRYPQTFQRDASTGNMTPEAKVVFFRGSETNVMDANPIVFMDGLSNKLHVAIKTQESSLTSVRDRGVDYNQNLHHITAMNYFLNPELSIKQGSSPLHPAINKHIILTVDYVPLQRWVHLAFVVDNKLAVVFVDGEVYSMKTVDEFKASRSPELDQAGRPLDVNLIVDKTTGDIVVGRNTSVGNGIAAPGFINRLSFLNYSPSLDDIKTIYNKGPVGGRSIPGVAYGLRNPIYKL
jgi:hypothetical protein